MSYQRSGLVGAENWRFSERWSLSREISVWNLHYPDNGSITLKLIENYEYTWSSGNNLLSQKDLILKRGEKTVFTFQNRASSRPFHEISPRNLTLFFNGKTVYGAIGILEISVGLKEKNMEQRLVWSSLRKTDRGSSHILKSRKKAISTAKLPMRKVRRESVKGRVLQFFFILS